MITLPVKIHEHERTYPIVIGAGVLSHLPEIVDLSNYSTVALLTDEHIPEALLDSIDNVVDNEFIQMIIKPGEITKDMETVEYVWNTLIEDNVDRKALLINLGGGVICDIGGFAAATYVRGIDFVQIPTTLLSQVDASIGGKTGVNFGGIKNIVGAFAQPIAVIIDTDTLTSLPEREFVSGFAEIIKHGLIADPRYLKRATAKAPRDFSSEELIELIADSCKIKTKIVESDERETGGERKLLNFGHTIGHAIEAIALKTKKPLLHGEAIAVGMVAEAKLSELYGTIEDADVATIEKALTKAGLPVRYKTSPDAIRELIASDKKNEFGDVKWTLLKEIGTADYNIVVANSLITKAIDYVTG